MPPNDDTILSRMRSDARAIFKAGVQAVAPNDAVRRHCRRDGRHLHIGPRAYDLDAVEHIYVVGAGKATAAMAQAVESLIGDRIDDGLICVKYGHTAPLNHVRTIEAGHPLPDTNGADAAGHIFSLAEKAKAGDLFIVLISGGGSALLPLPPANVSLSEKQAVSDVLIGCGATIHEINAIRKHLSAIKGGQLAQAAAPAQTVALILSDVVGDDLDVIASGPTVPDSSTFANCWDSIQRYQIAQRLPASVTAHLQSGLAGKVPETPKPDTQNWQHVHNHIIGSNLEAILAAAKAARDKNYNTLILSSRMEGETRTVAQVHGAIAREVLANDHPVAPPACILSGGETTVTLKGDGLGGRNQEFALAAAMDINGAAHIVVLSGGTDGNDGPTDAAGAIADDSTVQRAEKAGLNIRQHLENNDAHPFFKQLNDLLITGPTNTNVMDLRILLVRPHEKIETKA